MASPVSIFSEFQPLEEVIIGKAYPPEAFAFSEDEELQQGLEQILRETEEDLQELVKIVETFGATVQRPHVVFELGDNGQAHKLDLNAFEFTFPNHPLMPRDTVLIHGQQILQTFTRSENRYFENWAYYDLFKNYFDQGANWLSMPQPMLQNKMADYSSYHEKPLLFHAANVLKCGRDIFYSQPATGAWSQTGKGTQAGLKWLQQQVGPDYRWHGAPCAGHLDGKIALLRPGVLLAWDEKHVPDVLKNWEIIRVEGGSPFPEHFRKIKKQRFYKDFVQQWLKEWIGYVDETVFDVNVFSLSENLVITNGYNERVFKKLQGLGIEATPWNFRHQYFWDGAIHCVTLDIRRRGGCENFL